jgi:uncharacterized protein
MAGTLADLSLGSLDAALIPDIGAQELLLLGTGDSLLRPPATFVESARLRGWRVEPMDSAAAARTFNVLVAEERLVGALIL